MSDKKVPAVMSVEQVVGALEQYLSLAERELSQARKRLLESNPATQFGSYADAHSSFQHVSGQHVALTQMWRQVTGETWFPRIFVPAGDS